MQKNGFLSIPLYHSTSSIFLDSILEYGLAAKNPVKEFKILDFFNCAFELCEKLYKADPIWEGERFICKKISSQSAHGFNFRHGGTYLSPSKDTALRYAKSNYPVGSEALCKSLALYDKIKNYDSKSCTKYHLLPAFTNSPVLQIIKKEPRPILIEIFNAEINSLKSENGEDALKIISKIENAFYIAKNNTEIEIENSLEFIALKTIDPSKAKFYKIGNSLKKNFNSLIQQYNFELAKIIPANQLKIYEIEQ